MHYPLKDRAQLVPFFAQFQKPDPTVIEFSPEHTGHELEMSTGKFPGFRVRELVYWHTRPGRPAPGARWDEVLVTLLKGGGTELLWAWIQFMSQIFALKFLVLVTVSTTPYVVSLWMARVCVNTFLNWAVTQVQTCTVATVQLYNSRLASPPASLPLYVTTVPSQ